MQIIEILEPNLCKLLKIDFRTLRYYLDGWRFAHVKHKKQSFLNPETQHKKAIRVYFVTVEDIEKLREFKRIRRHCNGIQ